MALGTFIAGPCSLTWNATDIGLTDESGVRIIESKIKEPVTASLYGGQLIDKIYQGQKVTVMFTLQEWTANIRLLLNPYNAAMGVPGVVGRLDTSLAQALVATALAGTPAAGTLGPATLTVHSTIVSDENSLEWAINAGLRKLPILMDCYLVDVSGVKRYYTMT